MIPQAKISEINSREECIPFLENGMLPLITAPMYSVVDENNYEAFINNKINVCLPRTCGFNGELLLIQNKSVFLSCSLNDFIKNYLLEPVKLNNIECICIDTANGNMKKLHDAIIDAKKIHGSNLIIMAGNVCTIDAFMQLVNTGVDYIRVGIGGSSNACTTTKNVGVGQIDLEELIKYLHKSRINTEDVSTWKKTLGNVDYDKQYKDKAKTIKAEHQRYYDNALKLNKVKIVADGISTYIKQCETKYGFNDNGYAAINKLLYAGADLVMIGSLFAQSLECASDKYLKYKDSYSQITQIEAIKQFEIGGVYSKYYGMSTHIAQAKYKPNNQRSSEGSINYLPVQYTLSQWLYGDSNQDNYPYLSGWVNCLKSAMSYTNSLTLNEFKYK